MSWRAGRRPADPYGSYLDLDLRKDGGRRRVHVREDGPRDAPPLLLIHGFSGSMRWYDAVVPLLADDYRVIRLDLLGHGSTAGAGADAPEQARMVEAVLERLDLHGVTIVGHSFGADVAVEVAEHDDRTDRLVIVCQAPDYSDADLPRGRAVMTVPVLGSSIHRGAKTLAAAAYGGARVLRPRSPMLPLARRAVADFRALDPAMFRVILVQRRDRMAAHPLDEQVRASGKPALVLLGGQDHFYGARSATRYAAAGARVEILPESGHSPLVEFPEKVAELLREFERPVRVVS